MKQILLSLFILSLCASCIGEDMDDCKVPMRNLKFSHYCLYDDNTSFDYWIGNDVMLHLYQDKQLKLIRRIPYAQISGGQTYSYPKQYGGEVDVVCWAVKAESQTPIPQGNAGDDFYSQLLLLPQGATTYNPFYIDLFLGTDVVENDPIDEDTTHDVKMINTAYLMTVNLTNAGSLQTRAEDLYVVVDGVMNTENLYYQGVGEEAEVKADFTAASTQGSYTTNVFGVLPSADAQTVSLSVYHGSTRIASIRTPEQAVAGGRMIINIRLGESVSIVVNDWDLYITDYEWM